MATRMQQRRGTAAQWTSANPILNAGEIGWESDTNKFKIGDGTNHWADLDYFIDQSAIADYVLESDLGELTQDIVGAAIVAGQGLVKFYDDGANTITLAASQDVVKLDTTQTLTNKTIDLGNNTIVATFAQLNGALTDEALLSRDGADTITNKTIALGNNTVSGTLAEFNSALQGADFASLAGAETLTNKTIAFGDNDISATLADLNAAVSDADLVSLDGAETLTNKTISSADNTLTIAASDITNFHEEIMDMVDTVLVAGSGIEKSYDDASNTLTVSVTANVVTLADAQTLTNKTIDANDNTITLTSANVSDFAEAAVDKSANALTSGTHTNITVTYDDNAGTISLSTPGYSDEQAQDAVGNNVGSGLVYNDSTGSIYVNSAVFQARVADVSDTEISYLNGVTSAIQTQLDSKASTTALSNHEADTTNIHGIANTANIVFTTDTGTVTSAMIANGTIVNDDINALAGIALSKLATDPLARANHTGTQTASTISDFDTQVRTSRLDQMAAPTAAVSLNSQKITNLATPTNSTDAATKAYVDGVTEGLHIHSSVKAATTANINLSTDVEAGDTLDGVTLAAGDRILVKNQSTASQNGIYVVQSSGAAVRAEDFDQPAEIDSGDFVFVDQGTINGNTGWVQINIVGTVGTDPVAFTQFAGAGTYTAGNGLTLTGTVFSINTATTVDLNTAQTLTNKTLTSPTLTTPALGTPASGVMTNVTGLPLTTGVTGTLPVANGGTGVTTSTGTGNVVLSNSPTLVTPALGTPSSATLTNATGLPLTTGVTGTLPVANGGTGITSLGSGVATFLGTPSSANLASAVTDETGSGALVFATSPTLVTPRVQMAINAQTGTSYTAVLADASNKLVTLDNASAITLTLPPSVFSVGDSVIFQQTNSGQVTFAAGSGVTITSAGATTAAPKIRTRYSSATMICTGTNTFTVIGDIV